MGIQDPESDDDMMMMMMMIKCMILTHGSVTLKYGMAQLYSIKLLC